MSLTRALSSSDRSSRHPRLTALVLMLVVLLTARTASAQDGSPWERAPYRMALVVTSDRAPGLGPSVVSNLQQQLTRAIEVHVGNAWQLHPEALSDQLIEPTVSVSLEQRLLQLARRGLSDLPADELAKFAINLDKVLFLHVRSDAATYTVEARDYDIRTGTLGTRLSKPCEQRPMLAAIAFDALLSAFSPLAEVDTVSGDLVSLRLKASAIPFRDPKLQLVEPGDLFRPIVRYNYRDGSLRRFQQLEWTYLQASGISAAAVDCKLYTGLRSPISSRRRGLIEQLAVVVRPPTGNTRLQVLSTATESEPLPGYEIHAQAPGQVSTQLLGETDRTGSLTIPADETPLRILLIKNGGEVLARLPIVPGAEPTISVKVPDDRLRLRAESIIAGIQEQVIDVLSRRQVLLAQAESQLEQGNIARAQTMLRELQLLKSAEAFQAELNTQERKIFTNDARMKRRIDKLFGDTREVVRIHLDPQPVETLAAEINKAGR